MKEKRFSSGLRTTRLSNLLPVNVLKLVRNGRSSLVLGIMSGTSVDGVDYAVCRINARRIVLVQRWHAAFPSSLRRRLHDAATGEAHSHEVAQLHHDLGRFYANHAQDRRNRDLPEIVGLHGQTVFHNPDPRAPATLQLGEPAYLAERLRIPVVSNFRASDMAAGGQGAPLATAFHVRVWARRGEHVCMNNLGGISNVTSIDWRQGEQPTVAAFDTGPANVLIDLAVRRFTSGRRHLDQDGAWAAQGNPSEGLLKRWLRHPYFGRRPPKSTGRELFGEAFFTDIFSQTQRAGLSRFDALATLTEFTARTVAMNYHLHLPSAPSTVILTGGGAANPVLVRAIRTHLRALCGTKLRVITSEQAGWPLQSVEPAAFGLLAWLRLRGVPGNLLETTGARRAVLLGQVIEA